MAGPVCAQVPVSQSQASQLVGGALSGGLALVQMVGSTVAGQVVGWLEPVRLGVEAVVGQCQSLGPYRFLSPYSGQIPVP